MKKYLEVLRQVSLFDGIVPSDIESVLNCLSARTRRYAKNEIIFMNGDVVKSVGIVLSGSVQILKEDALGNRTILTTIGALELFAESFSCAGTESIGVTVIATQESDILLIDYKRIITTCSSACIFHTKLIGNMLSILAKKNIMLHVKMEHLSKRTTREKLISFLSEQACRTNKRVFTIPFNREELADYLCVDRSAMSAELSKLQKDGIIRYHKNQFELC